MTFQTQMKLSRIKKETNIVTNLMMIKKNRMKIMLLLYSKDKLKMKNQKNYLHKNNFL